MVRTKPPKLPAYIMPDIPKELGEPTAILTSDWHLRETLPECRTDNFFTSQWFKVGFVSWLSDALNIPVIHAGDLFDHWKPSPELLTQTMETLPKRFWTVAGNHDLPQHNLELYRKCGLQSLETAKKIELLQGVHWGQSPDINKPAYQGTFAPGVERKVCVWHTMTYVGKSFPGDVSLKAPAVLRRFPQWDLIVTGHNHKAFAISSEDEKRWLVNPGSLTRQDASQINFRPRVYIWFAKLNKIHLVYLPLLTEEAVSREHIDAKANRDSRMEAFISRLNLDWGGDDSFDFETNMETFFTTNKIRQSVKDIILKAIDHGGNK